MRNTLLDRAAAANRGGDPEPLEQMLMDLMSLGQRLNWEQLAIFVQRVEDPPALQRLAGQARNAGAQLPVLFAAVELSDKPGAVAAYLANFSQSGLADLGTSLRFGSGAVDELVRAQPADLRLALARAGRGFPAGLDSFFARPPILRCVFRGLR